MRKIYLIRHCEPEFRNNRRTCLSREDLPLSRLGRMRSILLSQYMSHVNIDGVFCSPLLRARETAAALSSEVEINAGLQELKMGAWEGLTFDEIRALYPKLYEDRGKTPFTCCPPGGEMPVDCLERIRSALLDLLKSTQGDIAVIAHAGVNRLLLCSLLGISMNDFLRLPQPYGCVNTVFYDGNTLVAGDVAAQPHPVLSADLCEKLMAETPEKVWKHAGAVAMRAYEIGAALVEHGFELDLEQLNAAALLHDIARMEPNHAEVGGAWLTALGYPNIGAMIAAHHELPEGTEKQISESTVLYLADKQIQGTDCVSVESRFAASMGKCKTSEARRVHDRRYQQAKRVETMIQGALESRE